jgi:hypothetical protein
MNTDMSVEISLAAVLCLVILYLIIDARCLRKKARIADSAGLATASLSRTVQGAPEIMIIGSTGRSLFNEEGGLYETVRRCRGAKIMLLDPREYGAFLRAQSKASPEITREAISEQVVRSLECIKALRAENRTIRLKLYPDIPLFKLAILGDHVHVRHYHMSLDVLSMPEYVFRNQPPHGGLYMAFYRYFQSRWQDPDIPEYDLETDELVYRDELGYEVLRENFNGSTFGDELSGNESAAGFFPGIAALTGDKGFDRLRK